MVEARFIFKNVFDQGQVISAAEIGLLASIGVIDISVVRTPKIAVLSTGNEIVDASTADDGVKTGQVFFWTGD